MTRLVRHELHARQAVWFRTHSFQQVQRAERQVCSLASVALWTSLLQLLQPTEIQQVLMHRDGYLEPFSGGKPFLETHALMIGSPVAKVLLGQFVCDIQLRAAQGLGSDGVLQKSERSLLLIRFALDGTPVCPAKLF